MPSSPCNPRFGLAPEHSYDVSVHAIVRALYGKQSYSEGYPEDHQRYVLAHTRSLNEFTKLVCRVSLSDEEKTKIFVQKISEFGEKGVEK